MGLHDPSPLTVAQQLGKAGYSVFPCAPDKTPLVKWKENSTADANGIARLWPPAGAAMIGLPTGPKNGLFVIDLDVDKTTKEPVGERNLVKLGFGNLLERCPGTTTPSGGIHLYLQYPSAQRLGSSAGALTPQVDTRGDGGYVIAPGSVCPAGKYIVRNEPFWQAALPEVPEALLEALAHRVARRGLARALGIGARSSSRWAQAALESEVAAVRRARPGSRNDTLNKAAFSLGRLVAGGGACGGCGAGGAVPCRPRGRPLAE